MRVLCVLLRVLCVLYACLVCFMRVLCVLLRVLCVLDACCALHLVSVAEGLSVAGPPPGDVGAGLPLGYAGRHGNAALHRCHVPQLADVGLDWRETFQSKSGAEGGMSFQNNSGIKVRQGARSEIISK